MSKSLGKILEKLRKQQGITQKELSKGLCSVATLSRIEKGEREPNQILFDSLISRLGKDSTKWELVLEENDRYLFQLRFCMEYLIQMQEWDKLEEIKRFYETFDNSSEKLQEQYSYLIQAILYESKKQYNLALEFCIKGLEKTEVEINFNQFQIKQKFSKTELRLLCLIGKVLFCQRKIERSLLYDYWLELSSYIERFCTDEQYCLKFYIQSQYYLANILYEQEQYQESSIYLKKLIKEIREKRSSYYLKPILKLLEQLQEKGYEIVFDLSKEELYILFETIEEWERENKKLQGKEQYLRTNNSVYSINEIIKTARNSCGKTQEDMIGVDNKEGIVGDQKGLSYIENGKRNPRKSTSSYYLEQLGLAGKEDGFQLAIDGDDFEIQELRMEVDFYLSIHKMEEAKKALSILKSKIDLSYIQNEQYIRASEFYIKSEIEELETEEKERELLEILALTLPNIYEIIEKKREFYFLTREELALVMNLGCIYHQNKKYQKALEYYKMIEKYFAETYLLSSGSLYKTLLYNIAQINGMLGNYNEAMEKSKICIFIEMISFQVNGLCREIYNLGWCYGKMMLEEQNSQKKEQYKEYCKYFFQQSNVIAKFYQDEQAVEKIEYELKEEYKIKFSRNAIEV